jgi:hypothetical protein
MKDNGSDGVIKCRELIICDDEGIPKIELRGGFGGESPSTISFLRDGKNQMQISSDLHNHGSISIYDKDHKILLSLGGSHQGCGLSLHDSTGKLVKHFSLKRDSSD